MENGYIYRMGWGKYTLLERSNFYVRMVNDYSCRDGVGEGHVIEELAPDITTPLHGTGGEVYYDKIICSRIGFIVLGFPNELGLNRAASCRGRVSVRSWEFRAMAEPLRHGDSILSQVMFQSDLVNSRQ